MDTGEDRQVVRITAQVRIRAADGAPLDETALRSIAGAASDLGLSSASYEIHEMGLLGGRVQLSHDGTKVGQWHDGTPVGVFRAVAEHESLRQLTAQEIELLIDRTSGDWSDGVGGSFFEYLGKSLGLFLWVCWDGPLQVAQFSRREARFGPWSELAKACWQGNLEEARAALDAGDDVNGRIAGLPILQGAIANGKGLIAELLIERGADVHARDLLDDRRDPLWACATTVVLGDAWAVLIARSLLERGAGPVRRTAVSPLAIAKRRKWDHLVQVLEEFAGPASG
jgi:hypothetical protein